MEAWRAGARVAFLGPPGTFTEEALRSDPALASCEPVAMRSFAEVLGAVGGDADLAFVALENSIEGTVSAAADQLVFDRDLVIVHEVVLPVRQHLLAPRGLALGDVRAVASYPHATGQCRGWLDANLPGVTQVATTSTAEASRMVGAGEVPAGTVAIGTELAASVYGLAVLASGIEDHEGNATRFVLVGPADAPVPAPTGQDKTTVVCFQSADRPGSLHGILGHFTARDINLVKLESRPTKHRLGDYCFLVDFEGHVGDEVVADCLRDLHASLRSLKWLGSYPAAAGEGGQRQRRAVTEAWRAADEWVATIQDRVLPG